MDRLKDEYYDENEDFSEIDALLDAWSCREVDTPEDLHQKIMGALPLENKKRNGKKYYRYWATAALAAAVLLASVGLGQLTVNNDETESDKLRSGDTVVLAQNAADVLVDEEQDTINSISDSLNAENINEENQDADKNNAEKAFSDPDIAVSAQSAGINTFTVNSAIDWQKEKEDKEILLAEQEALLNEKQAEIDTAKTEEIIAWLKECLEAIEQEDSEKYEELLKNSPLSE